MKTRAKNLSESKLAFLAPSFLHSSLTSKNVTLCEDSKTISQIP